MPKLELFHEGAIHVHDRIQRSYLLAIQQHVRAKIDGVVMTHPYHAELRATVFDALDFSRTSFEPHAPDALGPRTTGSAYEAKSW